MQHRILQKTTRFFFYRIYGRKSDCKDRAHRKRLQPRPRKPENLQNFPKIEDNLLTHKSIFLVF
jgi:hypothetical protein